MRAHLGLALAVAAVAGLAAGVVDGIGALSRNLDAPRFALVCATAPALPTVVLACLVAMPLGLFAAVRGRSVPAAIADHAGAFVFLALLGRACLRSSDLARASGQPDGWLASWMIAGGVVAAVIAGTTLRATVAALLRDAQPSLVRRRLGAAATTAVLIAGLAALPSLATVRAEGRRVLLDDARGRRRAADELDVVLITIDTLRADRLASVGGAADRTPALDRLAAGGASFANAISAASWTLPSIASILSGLSPTRHGAGRPDGGFDLLARTPLDASARLLPEVLRERGYLTAAIVTNPYLSMRYGFGRGFDRFENVTMESEAFLALHETLAVRLLASLWPALVVGDRGEVVSDRAIAWLERHRDEKLFLWLHYLDPHAPYGDPSAAGQKSLRGDLLGPAREAEVAGAADGSLGDRFEPIARLRAGEIRLDAAQRRALVRLYDAGVRYADAQVGRVLGELDRLGLAAHTLVVVAGDHGEEFWEHGGVEHGHTMYEEIVHVPLVVRWPGGPAGARVADVVSLVDLAPTIADLTKAADGLGEVDGSSLRPLLAGRADVPRLAWSEGTLFADDKRALRGAGFKYVVSANGKEELYDLVTDPRELRDLAGSEVAVAPLRERLRDRWAALGAPPPGVAAGPARDPSVAGAGPLRERLRALGYAR